MKIHLEKNFITKKDAQAFIDIINDTEIQNGKVLSRRVLRFGHDLFNTTPNGTENRKDVLELLKPHLEKVKNLINNTFNHSSKIEVSTVWISKQAPGSKIMTHDDIDGGKSMHYSHSAIIYLNTQEKDGELFFPLTGDIFKPEFGDMIAFECRPKEAKHGVKTTSQERYAIAMWFTDQDKYRLFE